MKTYFKSKIHRAKITQCDIDYEGSVTIDSNLMKAAKIDPYEQVHVWNVTNGKRFVTYAIEGEPDSGIIGINGAAVHLCNINDVVIIATFKVCEENLDPPIVVLVDKNNKKI